MSEHHEETAEKERRWVAVEWEAGGEYMDDTKRFVPDGTVLPVRIYNPLNDLAASVHDPSTWTDKARAEWAANSWHFPMEDFLRQGRRPHGRRATFVDEELKLRSPSGDLIGDGVTISLDPGGPEVRARMKAPDAPQSFEEWLALQQGRPDEAGKGAQFILADLATGCWQHDPRRGEWTSYEWHLYYVHGKDLERTYSSLTHEYQDEYCVREGILRWGKMGLPEDNPSGGTGTTEV